MRRTGIAVVFGIAAVFVADGFLPTTTSANRQGLFITAGLVAATGVAWFGFVPRRWFGGWRVFAAAALAEIVLLAMVVLTGGLGSDHIGYLLLPAIALILSGSVSQMAALGGLIVVGIAGLAISSALGGGTPDARDSPISRLLLLATAVTFCAAVARTTGRTRATITDRAAGLADESLAVMSLAMTDALTNLPNRRALDLHLSRLTADAARTGLPLSVMALDLDGLKRVNDAFGHDSGDALLRNFAESIDRVIRGSDVGLRIGGDEFLILLPRTGAAQAGRVADRLKEEAAARPTARGPAQFSFGITTLQSGEQGSDLVRRADAALYASKQGRFADGAETADR